MSTHLITHITLTESYTQTEHQSTPVPGVKRVHTKTRFHYPPQNMQPLVTECKYQLTPNHLTFGS